MRTITKAVSLIIIYTIPVLYLMLVEGYGHIGIWQILLTGIIGIVSLYNFYEIGYIQNDTETVKWEKHPNKRLSHDRMQFYEKNKAAIYTSRVLVGMLLAVPLYMLTDIRSFVYFHISLILILLTYQWYNHIRSRISMFVYLLLVSLRYISPLLLFSEYFTLQIALVALMTFPIVKTLSFKATKPESEKANLWFRRHIIKFDVERLTEYRAVAYAVMVIIGLGLYAIGFLNIYHLVPLIYMLLYRTFLWLIIKLGFKPKEYLKG